MSEEHLPENDLADQQRPADPEEPLSDPETLEADPADVEEQQRSVVDDETWPPASGGAGRAARGGRGWRNRLPA